MRVLMPVCRRGRELTKQEVPNSKQFFILFLCRYFLKKNSAARSFHAVQFIHSKNNILAEMDFFCEF